MPNRDAHEASNNPAKCNSAGMSRRALLSGAAALSGGATLVAAGVGSTGARADAAKMTQTAAAYQDTPKGEQNCANCSLFVAPAACGVVAGTISSSGWCKLYQKNG